MCVHAGVVQTAADSKLMQLQTSGLETLKQLLSALGGKLQLPGTVADTARRQLTSLTTEKRSSDVKLLAEEALKLLATFVTDTDAPMSES